MTLLPAVKWPCCDVISVTSEWADDVSQWPEKSSRNRWFSSSSSSSSSATIYQSKCQ